MELSTGLNVDISMALTQGDHAEKQLLHENYMELDPQISPDGRWMAYSSNESGRYEIYVRPYPEVNGGKWQVSTGGGDWPLWSRDERELFYRSGEAFMAVSVKTEPTFSWDTPKMMFQGTYSSPSIAPMVVNWDVSPDGGRFLLLKPLESGRTSAEGESHKINIVVNWFEELKQRVPSK
jgi:hypothetical protein